MTDSRPPTIPRRQFLNTIGAAAGMVFLHPLELAAARRNTLETGLTRVALTRALTYDRAAIRARIQHLFESLGGLADVVSAGDTAAIKINLTGGSGAALSPKLAGVPITECMWTHPEVLRAVGELIIDAGVRGQDITIVEALWDAASFNNFGYLQVQHYLGARVIDLNTMGPYADFVDLPVGPGGCYYGSFTVNRILNDVAAYISIPKLKDHYEAGFTGALKNQVGMVPMEFHVTPTDTGRRAALHNEGGPSSTHLPRSVCDLNLARPVHLAVIDGVKNARGGEGGWCPTFQPAEDHILLAGKDPVATDAVSVRYMDRDPEALTLPLPGGGVCDNHLELLAARGAGTNRLSEIGLVGDGASLITSAPEPPPTPVPADVVLGQNFPNPFNSTTLLRFFLPAQGQVTMRIFNVQGQQVETLVDAWYPSGSHDVRWSPRNVPRGSYVCQVRMNGGSPRNVRMIYTR